MAPSRLSSTCTGVRAATWSARRGVSIVPLVFRSRAKPSSRARQRDGKEISAGQDLAAGEGQLQRPRGRQLLQHVHALGGGKLRLVLGRVVTHHALQVAAVGQLPQDRDRHVLARQPGKQRVVGVCRRLVRVAGIEVAGKGINRKEVGHGQETTGE